MKKLIWLLNSYERYKEWKYNHRNYIWKYDKQWWISAHRLAIQEEYLWEDESWAIIISKWYNFIKWLVDNDKIDMKKHFYDKMNCVWYPDLNIVLCELAVSDTPIDDLISYLR